MINSTRFKISVSFINVHRFINIYIYIYIKKRKKRKKIIFSVRITSRSFYLKKVNVLIMLGNSDPFLITYCNIFKRLFYQNHISLSMNTSVNSRERVLWASTSRITLSMGLQILVSVQCQVWVFVSIWYLFGKKVQNKSLVLVNQLFCPFARI